MRDSVKVSLGGIERPYRSDISFSSDDQRRMFGPNSLFRGLIGADVVVSAWQSGS